MVAELENLVEAGLPCVRPWQMGEKSAPHGREECASWARCGAGSRVVAEEPSHRLTQRYVDWPVGYQ